jgi:hypothetical protein
MLIIPLPKGTSDYFIPAELLGYLPTTPPHMCKCTEVISVMVSGGDKHI